MGRCVLRMADAPILPFEFQNFSNTVQQYATEIKQSVETMRTQSEDHNRLLRDNQYQLAADPKEPFTQPEPMDEVPFLNFAPLDNALASLDKSAAGYTQALQKGEQTPVGNLEKLNEILYKSERYLTHPEGLPRRPWFQHQIYAPGFYTGYGVKTLPMIREAIEQKNWAETQQGIQRVSETLTQFTTQINQATLLMK